MKKQRPLFIRKLFYKLKAPIRWFERMNYQPSFKRIEFLNLRRKFLQFEDASGDEIVLSPQETVRVNFSGKKAEPEVGLWFVLTKMNDNEIAELTPSEQEWRSTFIRARRQHYIFQEMEKWKDPSYKQPSIHEGIQRGLQWQADRDPDFIYKLLTIHGVEEWTIQNRRRLKAETNPTQRDRILHELKKLDARRAELSKQAGFATRIISSPFREQVNPDELLFLDELCKEVGVPLEAEEAVSTGNSQRISSHKINWIAVNNDGHIVNIHITKKSLSELPHSLLKFPYLRELYLANNQFTDMSKLIGELTSLELLDLGNNQLTTLPESFGNLKNLSKLYLGNNQLTTLPASIGQLENLRNLNLSSNNLTSLPESISQLKNLAKLSLHENQLTLLPEFLGNLSNLNDVTIWKNQLTELPDSIGHLTMLTELKLWENRLSSLPDTIIQLTNLRSVVLTDNCFSELPRVLGKLSNLQTLEFTGNPHLGKNARFFTNTSYQELLTTLENEKKSLV